MSWFQRSTPIRSQDDWLGRVRSAEELRPTLEKLHMRALAAEAELVYANAQIEFLREKLAAACVRTETP